MVVVDEWAARSKDGLLANLVSRLRLSSGMNQILPNLFLGSLRDASDEEQLTLNRIHCVVSCHEMTADNQVHSRLGLRVLRIRIADAADANISVHFAEACRFIHESRLAGKAVLVHCLAGVSRSASVVAAYLMVACELDFYSAFAFLSSRRRSSNPNFGFRMQLCKFAEKEAEKVRLTLRDFCGTNEFDEQLTNDRIEIHGKEVPQLPKPSNSPKSIQEQLSAVEFIDQ